MRSRKPKGPEGSSKRPSGMQSSGDLQRSIGPTSQLATRSSKPRGRSPAKRVARATFAVHRTTGHTSVRAMCKDVLPQRGRRGGHRHRHRNPALRIPLLRLLHGTVRHRCRHSHPLDSHSGRRAVQLVAPAMSAFDAHCAGGSTCNARMSGTLTFVYT